MEKKTEFIDLFGRKLILHKEKGVKSAYDTKRMMRNLENNKWSLLMLFSDTEEERHDIMLQVLNDFIDEYNLLTHNGGNYLAILCNYKLTKEKEEEITKFINGHTFHELDI